MMCFLFVQQILAGRMEDPSHTKWWCCFSSKWIFTEPSYDFPSIWIVLQMFFKIHSPTILSLAGPRENELMSLPKVLTLLVRRSWRILILLSELLIHISSTGARRNVISSGETRNCVCVCLQNLWVRQLAILMSHQRRHHQGLRNNNKVLEIVLFGHELISIIRISTYQLTYIDGV